MLAQLSQSKSQAMSGRNSSYFTLKTLIFLKATCSAISRNGKHDTLIDSTAVKMQLAI